MILAAATKHAANRRQFGRPLADLELIKKKIAYLAATAYAMEATTYQTAALIDSGAEDYMLETAILKVFTTEALWQGVYETLQVFGGQGYFSNEPYERMMRDARINTIGEGANEVLKAFIALVGMRDIGEGLKSTLEGLKKPGTFLPTLWKFSRAHLGQLVQSPAVPVASPMLRPIAAGLARRVSRVRPDRRAAADHAPRSVPRPAIRPGADRRRGDCARDFGLHVCRDGTTRSCRARRPPRTRRPPSFICEWRFADSTIRSGSSATTTTA